MKKTLISILIVTLCCFIAGCVDQAPPDSSRSPQDAEDPTVTSSARYFNVTATSPAGYCVEADEYYNYYGDAPIATAKLGTVGFTNLAAFMANTAEPNEEMYFLVGVGRIKEGIDPDVAADLADLKNHNYKGIKATDYLDKHEWNKYAAENGIDKNYGSWNILISKLREGVKTEAAISDANYAKAAKLYFDYLKESCLVYADFLSSGHSSKTVPASAEYLKKFGIELACQPYTPDWQYHMQIVKECAPRLDTPISYLVKCTSQELWSLVDGNTDYNFIFYASEPNGKFVVSNSLPDPQQLIKTFPQDSLCYFDRTLSEGHIAFAYSELNMYDRLLYKQ